MNLVTEAQARECAMKALAEASPEAVEHLRDVAMNGGMIGRHYCACFYGTLARGSGVLIPEGNKQTFDAVQEFARTLGVNLVPDQIDPVESFVFDVRHHHTLATNPVLASVAMWCDEALQDKMQFSDSSLSQGISRGMT